jgi:hypothetical protein
MILAKRISYMLWLLLLKSVGSVAALCIAACLIFGFIWLNLKTDGLFAIGIFIIAVIGFVVVHIVIGIHEAWSEARRKIG